MSDTWEKACEENRKENEFVRAYIREHFGPSPIDPEVAQSEALKAYWESLGYISGSDEETFILPEDDSILAVPTPPEERAESHERMKEFIRRYKEQQNDLPQT